MKLETILGVTEEQAKELVKKLPTPTVKKIIEYRYGLTDGKYKSIQEVAKKFNMTLEMVRKYESKGLRMLKGYVPKKNIFQKIKSIFKDK